MRGFGLVDRNANRSCLIGERPRDALAYPPRRIGAELESFPILISLGSFHESDIALLYEVQQGQPSSGVVFRDINHQAKVASNEFVFALFQHNSSRPNFMEYLFQLLHCAGRKF